MEKRERKLEWSMVVMLVAGWLLPLMLIAIVLLYFVSSMLSRQIENTIVLSADKAVEICEIQLAETVSASKNASYITTVENSYLQYQKDGKVQRLYKEITDFLNQHYKYDDSIICTMLFFLDNPEQIYYAANSYQTNDRMIGGYPAVLFFQENSMEEVLRRGKKLSTNVELVFLDGRLYLIRNIVDPSFQPYAMIVIEIDPVRAFQSLESVWGVLRYEIYMDGEEILNSGAGVHFDVDRYDNVIGESSYVRSGNDGYAFKNVLFGNHKLTFLVMLDSKAIIDELAMVRYAFVLLIIFLIPLVGMIFRFFHTKVTKPVANLIGASRKIRGGEYGYQITEQGNSEEFTILTEAYNDMSRELQHQFQQIYLEELALRDASIMALQSQINPHFLNNTLELINWEARMAQNEKVSGMIEALGTMLSFTMNRKQLHFHTLAEELTYVDAYLYIISKRFENRFHVEREIEEALLQTEIPRLIIQPVIENAVEHGMKGQRKVAVFLCVYSEGTDVVIEIMNDRKLEEKEREKIAFLLSGQTDPLEARVSLGIRNVNERLKIIYGDSSGLTIRGDEDGNTVSTIRFRRKEEEKNFQGG